MIAPLRSSGSPGGEMRFMQVTAAGAATKALTEAVRGDERLPGVYEFDQRLSTVAKSCGTHS